VRCEILRSEVGSTLYGTGLPGAEDEDLMAVAIMPSYDVLGLRPFEGLQWRTANNGERSTADDTDLVIYSLRKYLTMASAGNPSILVALFGPDSAIRMSTEAGRELIRFRQEFISKQSGQRFLGYMSSQRRRMIDSRAGVRAPRANRPELIEQFGYDTKFAMHMLRLGYQGIELLNHGTLEMPIRGEAGDFLRSVRRGDIDYDEVLQTSDDLMNELEDLIEDCGWPDSPDAKSVGHFSVKMHQLTWADRGEAYGGVNL
jgi:predicted nucleotidyltransferase